MAACSRGVTLSASGVTVPWDLGHLTPLSGVIVMGNNHGMTGGGHRGQLGRRSRRLLVVLTTVLLLAMIVGLAVGLMASLRHLNTGP
jgi:hypothetical protein